MASYSDHLRQIRHNKRFVRHLGHRTPFFDWYITGLFYLSIHYIEAYLAQLPTPLHPQSHYQREWLMRQRCPFWNQIRRAYRRLSDTSRRARYLHTSRVTTADIVPSVRRYLQIKNTLLPYC